ncbi:MAG TPA: energy transducer TonB [Vicinamibacterales bacterium]|jgi:TonB family protein
MRPSNWLTCSAATIVAVSLCSGDLAAAPSAGVLRSFYVAKNSAFGGWGHTIVSIEPIGPDVRVRLITIASVNDVCPDIRVVQAADRIVRPSTVQALARVRLCDMTQEIIDQALARSKTPPVNYVDYLGSQQTVVADCGGLWDLSERLSEGMLTAGTPTSAAAYEAFGTSLVPELRSAKYATAFGDVLVNELEGYTGPPAQREPLPAEVLEQDSLPLITFVAPKFPPIALSARVTGDVRLRLTVNAETGAVTQVDRLAVKPLLADAAEQAVRAWTFDPARIPRAPIDVTLRFQIRCPRN